MKTKQFLKNSLYLSSVILLSSCINGANKSDKDINAQSGNLSYLYQDVPPENPGGAWKRIWSLTGPYSGDAAVDEITNKEEDNWKEIARTNNEGVFIQKDTTQERKYRFDGYLETPWMPILVDTVVTVLPEMRNVFHGRRCIVPANVNLIIANKELIFKCVETIIEGNIVAFEATYLGRGAGSVEITGDIVNIKGKIHLIGEPGATGARGRDGGYVNQVHVPCTNGQSGSPGGDGGRLYIKAHKKFNLADEILLSVHSGAGGAGGAAGNGNACHPGNPGPNGGVGSLQIEKPEQNDIQ